MDRTEMPPGMSAHPGENPFPHFRLAEKEDDTQLLEILEQGDFKGRISLLYSRRPCVIDSLKREGSQVDVYLGQEGDLAGFGACALNTMKLNGKNQPVAYLFSFRMNKNKLSALRHLKEGYAFHFHRMEQMGIEQCFTTILSENIPAVKMLEKSRKGMPCYDYRGDIYTYTLKTGGFSRLKFHWTFEELKQDTIAEMLEFYEQQIGDYAYGPLLREEDLLQGRICPHYSAFRLLRDPEGKIMAMGAIWDQRDYKQYRIMGYRGIYKVLRPLSRVLFPLLGYPALPEVSSILKMYSLSFCISRGSNISIYRMFLNHIRRHSREFDCLTIGLHQDNPLVKAFKGLPRITYKSRFYRVYQTEKNQEEWNQIPFIEIGRL